jgi:hypothetical protein
LSEEKQKQLESIKGWKWDVYDEMWQENFEQLKEHVEKHGKIPPKNSGKLGGWCNDQRISKNRNKLSEERQKQLESLGIWKWDVYDERWQENFEQLVKYVDKHGKIPAQKSGKLGNWCNNQRANFKKGELSEERQKQLEFLGVWKWNLKE